MSSSAGFGEFQEAFVATLNWAQSVREAASDSANFTVLKKLMPPPVLNASHDLSGLGTLLRWFAECSFITDAVSEICPCDRESRRQITTSPFPKQFTLKEMERGAVDVEMYECGQCARRERNVVYLNPSAIIETRRGGSREVCLLFGCALATTEWTFRIVAVHERPLMWIEVWIGDRFVAIDPSEPGAPEKVFHVGGPDEAPSWIIAVGEYECIDVTAKYVADVATVISARSPRIPESLFQRVVGLRDCMLRSKTDEEGVNEVNERQNQDMMRWRANGPREEDAERRCTIL
jgi:hypothetical protein